MRRHRNSAVVLLTLQVWVGRIRRPLIPQRSVALQRNTVFRAVLAVFGRHGNACRQQRERHTVPCHTSCFRCDFQIVFGTRGCRAHIQHIPCAYRRFPFPVLVSVPCKGAPLHRGRHLNMRLVSIAYHSVFAEINIRVVEVVNCIIQRVRTIGGVTDYQHERIFEFCKVSCHRNCGVQPASAAVYHRIGKNPLPD